MKKSIVKKVKNSKSIKKIEVEKKHRNQSKMGAPVKDFLKSTKATEIIKDIPVEHIVEETKPEPIASLKELEEKIMNVYEEKIAPIPVLSEKDTSSKENKARVEAVLFAIGKYIDDEAIASLCELDKRTTKNCLEELQSDYDKNNSALAVFREGNKWKINVREKYLSLVRKIVADTELSRSVMETLAVIAWKTPIYQNEVVKIRGNKCYDHIEELETAGFIGKDKKGRSYILKTTDKFYNYFDIDQKNLRGVMGEAKMPAQMTLIKEEEIEQPVLNMVDRIQSIETRSIILTEEDKIAEHNFLESIHQKIEEAARKADSYTSDIPRPMHEQEQKTATEALLNTDFVKEKGEDIVIQTDVDTDHHFQKPENQPQKPKQLTKKQLEKKFKDELQRVKEKTSEKK